MKTLLSRKEREGKVGRKQGRDTTELEQRSRMNYCVTECLRLRDKEGYWEFKAKKSEAKVWEVQIRETECDRLCELINSY